MKHLHKRFYNKIFYTNQINNYLFKYILYIYNLKLGIILIAFNYCLNQNQISILIDAYSFLHIFNQNSDISIFVCHNVLLFCPFRINYLINLLIMMKIKNLILMRFMKNYLSLQVISNIFITLILKLYIFVITISLVQFLKNFSFILLILLSQQQ